MGNVRHGVENRWQCSEQQPISKNLARAVDPIPVDPRAHLRRDDVPLCNEQIDSRQAGEGQEAQRDENSAVTPLDTDRVVSQIVEDPARQKPGDDRDANVKDEQGPVPQDVHEGSIQHHARLKAQ